MIDHARGKGGLAVASEAIWRSALAAVDPWRLVRESVAREGDVVRIKEEDFDLAGRDRVFLIAFGKAAAPMAAALAGILDDRLTSGIVVVPGPVDKADPRLEYIEASHPVPDAGSVEAGRRASR